MTALTGTGALIRLIGRRDRVWLPVWLLATAGIVLGRASTIRDTYPTAAARQDRFEQVLDIPMFMLLQGRAYDTTVGALTAQEALAGTTILAAFGAAVFLVRHTRSEEQSGRRELLGSTVVGRHATLTAALTVLLGSGLLLAVLAAAGLIGLGLPAAGSIAMGAVAGGAVWVGAVMAAVAAQVTESSRAAGLAAVGLFYGFHLVRGASDMLGDGTAWLGWLVPNGWLQQVRPYAGDRWWVFGLVLVLVAALLCVAYGLSARRDLAAGLVPARLGRASGGPSLTGPLGLAWRLHRGTALAWASAVLFLALGTGFAGGANAMEQYAQGEWLQEYAGAMGAADPAEAFFVYIAVLMSLLIGFYAVMATLRLRSEESGGSAEIVLANPVGRGRWAVSHLVLAMVMSTVLLVLLGLGFGLGAGFGSGDIGAELGRMLVITTRLAPAVWVMAAITMAAFGMLQRATTVVAWGALAVALGTDLAVHWGLPEWVFRALSPFAHVNPFYDPGAADLVGLTVVAAALVAAGLAGFRRRDLTA